MIGRGRGSLWSKFKAKNDDGTLQIWSKGIAALVVFAALFLTFPQIATGDDSGSPSEAITTTQEATDNATDALSAAELNKARSHYLKAKLWRFRANSWYFRLNGVRNPNGNRKMAFTGVVSDEYKRMANWRRQAKSYQSAYLAFVEERNQCHAAGFPRWYCPILIKAATRKGVRSWAHDPNLAFIICHESGFRPLADNPHSTAYGLFQMLTERSSDPYQQTLNGLRYIQGRYGSPSNATAFWRSHRWY